MGYVEETGVAQYLRDARIVTIYEGTTGIQANDLIGRKTLRDGGAAMTELLDEIDGVIVEVEATDELAVIAIELKLANAAVRDSLNWLTKNYAADANIPAAIADHFLRMLGVVCGGWQMARSAAIAHEKITAGTADESFYAAKIATARFYAEQSLPKAASHARSLRYGCGTMMSFTREWFEGE